MQRMTRQRLAVLGLLDRQSDFRSAQQIHDDLEERGAHVALATVYRTLQFLVESGQVDALRHDGEITYRKCRRAVHHHHLVCRNCGLTVELQGDVVETWARDLAAANGFVQVEHTLEFFGLCQECAAGDAS